MGILSAFRFAFQNLFFSPILYGVIASLAVFSSVWEKGDRFKDQLTDRFRSQDDTFDFVIVGGGVAGAVLANRLSQYHTVLLLEAGGETHPFQAIPGLSIFIPKNIGTDFSHKSVTQTKSCQACPHKKFILSQGKNLGGGGNLGYLMHLRGNPLDFDNWATITSDPTWGYEGVVPYFIQSEHFIGETTDKAAHGYGGPLQVQLPDYIGLANEWNLAGVEMGYSHVDLNGRHSEGFDTIFYPVKHGVRQATYRSYIQPVRNRRSLLIRKFAHVNKILIRDGTNEAYGVEYDRHGRHKFAFANKEVILSAGTLQTPKLLILSGVGQLEHLNALHIPVKSVLPVGKNLQDHIGTLLGPFYINQHKRTVSFDRDIDKQSFIKFAATGKGPLSTSGFQATAVLSSSFAKAQGAAGWPDIQLTLFGLSPHRMFYSDIGHAFGIREDILHRYYGDVSGKEKDSFFIMVTLARPVSKGDFCVPSKDPYKPAVIDPNYLSDPLDHDIKVLTEGVRRALFLAENTTTFRNMETWYSEKCFPGCDKVPFRSDAYWECYIRSYSIAMNDHVGTCAMGRAGSPYAVVNPELQVQGIHRLRVVDSSVMPTIVGTPTQAATIMVAEKASTLILDKWKNEAKQFYGPPGRKPGQPLHYIPGNKLTSQYGPPGLSPAPILGGDGFENYDSFSVIKDQFHPPSARPTGLIPLSPPPSIQVWTTPASFSNTVSTTVAPPQASVNSFGSTSKPLLSPEPSQVLLPPEKQSPTLASPTSSYFEITGQIVSSTPSYPISFEFDASRSEKSLTADGVELDDERVDIPTDSNSTGSRQGKSFGIQGTLAPAPEGNHLGQGVTVNQAEILHSTPIPTSEYFSTVTTLTPIREVTETEVLNEGPGFRVVRKRIRTTPRVVVHPRGHLGHQSVRRKVFRQKLNESLESLFLTTSSVRPFPKEIVKIRKRRPVPYGRRRTTPMPLPTTPETDLQEIEDATTSYGTVHSTIVTPITTVSTTELPLELKSPGRKRFVRRMYARPINFGKKRFTDEGFHKNEFIVRVTTTSRPRVTTTEASHVATSTDNPIQERIDLDADASVEVATLSAFGHGKDAEQIVNDPDQEDKITEEEDEEKITTKEVADKSPVVVFKNVELENELELTRQARSSTFDKNATNDGNYFQYNLLPEESRNPIMHVDLNPIPEILAPRRIENANKQHETFAVEMSTNTVNESSSISTEEDYGADEVMESNIEVQKTTWSPAKYNSDEYDSGAAFESELVGDSGGVDYDYEASSIDSQAINISDNNAADKNSNDEHTKKSLLPPLPSASKLSVNTSIDIYEDYDDRPGDTLQEYSISEVSTESAPVVSTTPKTTVNPRLNFRARNKLMRVHS